ncbi:hypothetical protein [Desulfovibrio sp. Huiquan2017]|uniref:hypothetical protein n=1 Tax=Desulfovibrio sp. Huiquan2017 TaxID=2816861 RepID=UPI001A913776|nr:hypothetical protein [Desulfovibrio sp. Huiquan2017]
MRIVSLTLFTLLLSSSMGLCASINNSDFAENDETAAVENSGVLAQDRAPEMHKISKEAFIAKKHGRDVIIKQTSTNVFQHSGGRGGDAQNNIGKMKR